MYPPHRIDGHSSPCISSCVVYSRGEGTRERVPFQRFSCLARREDCPHSYPQVVHTPRASSQAAPGLSLSPSCNPVFRVIHIPTAMRRRIRSSASRILSPLPRRPTAATAHVCHGSLGLTGIHVLPDKGKQPQGLGIPSVRRGPRAAPAARPTKAQLSDPARDRPATGIL